MSKDKLKDVMNKLNKKYGADIMAKGMTLTKKWLTTGIANVDWALGGGFFEGGFIELYGPPSSGKSTLALKVMARAQKNGKTCAYIDVEDAYDPSWAKTNGINNDELLLLNKSGLQDMLKEQGEVGISAEFILQVMIDLIDTKGVDILVLDSIACLVPKDELKKEMKEEAKMAGVAKLLNRALRVMNSKNSRASTIIFINQIRDDVGGYSPTGTPTTTPGGKAVKFYAFQRINIKRGKTVTKGKDTIGFETKLVVDKNKVAEPDRKVEFTMLHDSTVDRATVYFNLADKLKTFGEGLVLVGRTYSYNGEVVAKTKEEFENYLASNPAVFDLLEASLISSSIKTVDDKKEVVIDIDPEDIEGKEEK